MGRDEMLVKVKKNTKLAKDPYEESVKTPAFPHTLWTKLPRWSVL